MRKSPSWKMPCMHTARGSTWKRSRRRPCCQDKDGAEGEISLKSDPRRRALDELIKKAGKWMEVSDMNPWMLARVAGAKQLEP